MTRGSIGPSSKTAFILRLCLSPTLFIEYQTKLYVKKEVKLSRKKSWILRKEDGMLGF